MYITYIYIRILYIQKPYSRTAHKGCPADSTKAYIDIYYVCVRVNGVYAYAHACGVSTTTYAWGMTCVSTTTIRINEVNFEPSLPYGCVYIICYVFLLTHTNTHISRMCAIIARVYNNTILDDVLSFPYRCLNIR